MEQIEAIELRESLPTRPSDVSSNSSRHESRSTIKLTAALWRGQAGPMATNFPEMQNENAFPSISPGWPIPWRRPSTPNSPLWTFLSMPSLGYVLRRGNFLGWGTHWPDCDGENNNGGRSRRRREPPRLPSANIISTPSNLLHRRNQPTNPPPSPRLRGLFSRAILNSAPSPRPRQRFLINPIFSSPPPPFNNSWCLNSHSFACYLPILLPTCLNSIHRVWLFSSLSLIPYALHCPWTSSFVILCNSIIMRSFIFAIPLAAVALAQVSWYFPSEHDVVKWPALPGDHHHDYFFLWFEVETQVKPYSTVQCIVHDGGLTRCSRRTHSIPFYPRPTREG